MIGLVLLTPPCWLIKCFLGLVVSLEVLWGWFKLALRFVSIVSSRKLIFWEILILLLNKVPEWIIAHSFTVPLIFFQFVALIPEITESVSPNSTESNCKTRLNIERLWTKKNPTSSLRNWHLSYHSRTSAFTLTSRKYNEYLTEYWTNILSGTRCGSYPQKSFLFLLILSISVVSRMQPLSPEHNLWIK